MEFDNEFFSFKSDELYSSNDDDDDNVRQRNQQELR